MIDAQGVYRNPPWVPGPKVLLANELDDIVDWGQLAHGLRELWSLGTGKGVLVGVCDTGRPTHSDLINRVKFSKNFSRSFTDTDQQGHSTHVCGTIAAEKNGRGVIGVAYEAELCIAKVLGDDGSGDNIGVAKGIRYCLEKNCDIISMSLGGGFDPDIRDAVLDAVNSGKIVICAAGNEGKIAGRDTVNWPAQLEETIAIASYRRDGSISDFSSAGRAVDLAFPGEDILSCWLDDTYRRLSGTSMATPFASGTAAMLLSHQRALERMGQTVVNPVRNNASMLERFKQSAVDKGPAGRDDSWGWGIVDVKRFLDLPTSTTPAPVPVPVPVPAPAPAPGPAPVPGKTPTETKWFGILNVIQPLVYNGKEGAFVYVP